MRRTLALHTVLGVGIIGGLGVLGWQVWPVEPYCTTEQPSLVAGVSTAPLWAEAATDPAFVLDGVAYTHPVALAHAGHALLEAGDTDAARAMAERLWAHAEDGWLAYEFDWPGASQVAPWYSAMAQGEALGLFARLGMLEEASAVYPTLLPGSPVVADDGWPLEYVGLPPVLNGAIFSIGGLYHYWQATDDAGVRARLEAAIVAVARDVHRFRNPGQPSSYTLDDERRHADYHPLHERQLAWLAEASGMACLRRAAGDFDGDA